MTDSEVLAASLGPEELARVDALAEAHDLTRDEMIHKLVQSGLLVHEHADAPPVSPRRVFGPAS